MHLFLSRFGLVPCHVSISYRRWNPGGSNACIGSSMGPSAGTGSNRGSDVVLVAIITRFLPQACMDEWRTLTMRQPAAQVALAPSQAPSLTPKLATPFMEGQVDGAVDTVPVSWPAMARVIVRGLEQGL